MRKSIERYALLKVMSTVLVNASTKYSVTGAAKNAGVSIFAAKHALDDLYVQDMISLEKVGRTYQYQANLKNFLTRQWKVVFSLEELKKAKVIDRVLEKSDSISSIVLYGSTATGNDDHLSDFDIIVVADVNANTKSAILAQARDAGREINIQVYTPMEWRRKAEADKAFYEAVIIDSITLFGSKPVVL